MQANYNKLRVGCDLLACFVLLGLLAGVGCDDGKDKLVPVSGTVLIDGVPLKHGSIRISPDNARSAVGIIGEDGRFTLKSYKDGDGVVRGIHKATVAAGEYISEEVSAWHAPQAYSKLETSDLTVNIDGPTDSLTVELTWGGDKPFKTLNGIRMR